MALISVNKRAIKRPTESQTIARRATIASTSATARYLAKTIVILSLSTFAHAAVAATSTDSLSLEPAVVPVTLFPDEATSEYAHIEQQIDVGELREAQAQLETTLIRLQQTGDRYDGQLVEPLRLLGRVFHENGDYPQAAETLAQATQISRVANGLHSAEQLQLVHQEISSLKAMGNIVEANRRHEYAFSIARRHFGRYGEQLIPELLKIGVWYTSTGDVIGARDRFAEARLLLSSKPETAQSDDMLFALRGIARSYRDEAFPPFYSRPDKETAQLYERNGLTDRQSGLREEMAMRASINSYHRGSEALVDIVRIEVNRLADIQDRMQNSSSSSATEGQVQNETGQENGQENGQEKEADPRKELVTTSARRRATTVALDQIDDVIINPLVDKSDFIKSLLELGDWYLLMNKEARAFGYYQHAYRVAEKDPNSDHTVLLGNPHLLYFPRPRDPKVPETAPKESFEKGIVELRFDIDHRGEIRKLRTHRSQPQGMMDFNVRSSARVARYRPRIIDGLPQPSTEQTYRHQFDYFPRNRSSAPTKTINTDTHASTDQAGSGH